MKHLFAAALLLATPAAAQDVDALAQEYVDMPAQQAMMDAMFSAESMADQFRVMLPPDMPLTEDQITQIGELMSEQMMAMRPRMEEVMVDVSAETFTAEELQAMIEFYGSEVGTSILLKTQQMMSSFMGQLGPDMLAMQEAAGPQIMEIIMGDQ